MFYENFIEVVSFLGGSIDLAEFWDLVWSFWKIFLIDWEMLALKLQSLEKTTVIVTSWIIWNGVDEQKILWILQNFEISNSLSIWLINSFCFGKSGPRLWYSLQSFIVIAISLNYSASKCYSTRSMTRRIPKQHSWSLSSSIHMSNCWARIKHFQSTSTLKGSNRLASWWIVRLDHQTSKWYSYWCFYCH